MKMWYKAGTLLVAGLLLLSGCASPNESGEDKKSEGNSMVISASGSSESDLSESSEDSQAVLGSAQTSFFDDAVFVGDSVSLRLNYYCQAHKGALGKAQFLTAGSLGSGNALLEVSADSVHPQYQGEKKLIQDSVKAMGAKKVFIMLGMNDLNIYKIDGTVKNMNTLAQRILKQSPDAEIYLQSMTPILANHEKGQLTNKNLDKYNAELKKLAKEKGYHFADVASVMKLEDGSLKPEYCSDPEGMGIHFTDAGAEAWIDYLLQNAASF